MDKIPHSKNSWRQLFCFLSRVNFIKLCLKFIKGHIKHYFFVCFFVFSMIVISIFVSFFYNNEFTP